MEEIVKNVRVAGQEARDVTVRQTLHEDDERITREARVKKLDTASGNYIYEYDDIRARTLRLAAGCGLTEKEVQKTPSIEMTKLSKVFDKLNTLLEAEKSSSSDKEA